MIKAVPTNCSLLYKMYSDLVPLMAKVSTIYFSHIRLNVSLEPSHFDPNSPFGWIRLQDLARCEFDNLLERDGVYIGSGGQRTELCRSEDAYSGESERQQCTVSSKINLLAGNSHVSRASSGAYTVNSEPNANLTFPFKFHVPQNKVTLRGREYSLILLSQPQVPISKAYRAVKALWTESLIGSNSMTGLCPAIMPYE